MSTASHSGRTNLRSLLRRGARGPDIAAHLDALPASTRLAQCLAVTGSGVGRLYEAVADNPPLDLEDMVPPSSPDRGTVVYEGRNSLPLFSRFQKRFTRLESGEVLGHNRQFSSFATGPGYFVVKPASPDADVAGELWFDYIALPSGMPADWPAFRPNSVGMSRWVFMGTKDYIRRVAEGVVVGKAYKAGKALGVYFTLVRTC